MYRLLVSIIGVAALATALASAGQASLQEAGTVVAGDDLRYPIRFSSVDADAFSRRINDPLQLEEAPTALGVFYKISSPYWSTLVRADADAAEDDDGKEVALDTEALYYPDLGVAKGRAAGETVWLVLDRRQEAIINRYLRLGRAGALPPEPGILTVLAAAGRAGEPISLTVGERSFAAADLAELWRASEGLASTKVEPAATPIAADGDYWLVFTLPEGRTVQLLYDERTRTLTDHLGTERYEVSETLAGLVGGFLGNRPALAAEESPGSPLWWALIGGGCVAALVAAAGLRRR